RVTPTSSLFPYTTLFRSLVGLVDDDVVFVDDQEISPEAAREPIQLAPGTVHRVVVRHQDRKIFGFEGDLRPGEVVERVIPAAARDRKSTRLNSSHVKISY